MKTKKCSQTKFDVGDVVKAKHNLWRGTLIGAMGVVLVREEYLPDDESDEPYFYSVAFFDGSDEGEIANGSDLKFCTGMNDKRICHECKYNFLCPQSPILKCRKNGKFGTKFCSKCQLRFTCWSGNPVEVPEW